MLGDLPFGRSPRADFDYFAMIGHRACKGCDKDHAPVSPRGGTAWVDASYNQRVHRRTKQSPRDRWDGSEVPVRTLSARQIHEAFLHWDRRKVGPAGEIKLHGNTYYADPTLAGQTMVLRFDPMNLGEAYIHRNGRPLERVTTERLVTGQLLRSPKASEAKASKAARRFLDKITLEHEQQLARESRLIRMQDIPRKQEEDEL